MSKGSSILVVNAQDMDEDIQDNILYAITNGNQMIDGTPTFSIDEGTGSIRVNSIHLNREQYPMYNLTITVSLSQLATYLKK